MYLRSKSGLNHTKQVLAFKSQFKLANIFQQVEYNTPGYCKWNFVVKKKLPEYYNWTKNIHFSTKTFSNASMSIHKTNSR